jgi:pyrimidine operon attenuation protein/uracil phosphoribosyltransferase
VDEREVMTADEMRRAVARLAHEIVERHGGTDDLAIIGIQRRGAILAHRLAEAIADHERTRIPVGTLDISLYRDDLTELATYPIVRPTDLSFDITGRTLVLVDDVLFTGRTVRAALDALVDHGRPRAVRLAVLADRGHRELPIRADHVGRNLPTARSERVNVHVLEIDGADRVTLGRPSEPPTSPPASGGDGAPATG